MLTQRQENFVTEYLSTGNAAEAYRRAYPSSQKWRPESLYPKASTLLDNGKVAARIGELRTQATATNVMTLTEALVILSDIAKYGDRDSERIAAIGQLGKLQGWEADKKSIQSNIVFNLNLGGKQTGS